eukprot:5552004-Pyramimonas_sp.AAC.1
MTLRVRPEALQHVVAGSAVVCDRRGECDVVPGRVGGGEGGRGDRALWHGRPARLLLRAGAGTGDCALLRAA